MKLFLSFFLFTSSWGWAEESEQNRAYVDEPASCYVEKKLPCAVRIIQQNFKFEIEKAQIYGTKGSSLVFLNPETLRLLEGSLFVDSSQEVKIETGVTRAIIRGESLLQKPADKVSLTMTNFDGDLQVKGIFQKFEEVIPVGFTKWYAGANQKGELEQGVLTALDAKKVLSEWRNLTVFSKALAREKVTQYKKLWKNRVDISAEFYKEIVEARLAVEEQKRMQQEKRIQHEQEERQKLRQLFRERNNLN